MVNRPSAHKLGLISAPAFRLYLNLTGYWDRFGTFNGHLIGPTMRKVKRNHAGYLLTARGQIVTEGGKPTCRATHPHAVELFDADGTPLRERNPAVTKYPPITPDQLAQMAYAEHDLRNGIRRMRQEARDKALAKVLQRNRRRDRGRDRSCRGSQKHNSGAAFRAAQGHPRRHETARRPTSGRTLRFVNRYIVTINSLSHSPNVPLPQYTKYWGRG